MPKLMIKVATFNVALNVQRNIVDGSEKRVVKRCQDANANCAKNSAEFLANQHVDLAGLQETTPETIENFVKWMGEDYTYQKSTEKSSCTVVWKKELGPSVPLELDEGKVHHLRCCSAVYFPRYRLVFASIWLDHTWFYETDKLLVFKDLSKALSKPDHPIDRVILTMDSNDHSGYLFRIQKNKTFPFLGHTMKQMTWKTTNHTCCDDNGYRMPGDYIFDSDPRGECGIPPLPDDWTKYNQLMSDHLPVFYVTEVNSRSVPVPDDGGAGKPSTHTNKMLKHIKNFCSSPTKNYWEKISPNIREIFTDTARWCINKDRGDIVVAKKILSLSEKDWEYITLPKGYRLFRGSKFEVDLKNRATYFTRSVITANLYVPSNKRGYLTVYELNKSIKLFKLDSLYNANRLLKETRSNKTLLKPAKQSPILPYDVIKKVYKRHVSEKDETAPFLTRLLRQSTIRSDIIFSNWLCEQGFSGYHADMTYQSWDRSITFPSEIMLCNPKNDLTVIKEINRSKTKSPKVLRKLQEEYNPDFSWEVVRVEHRRFMHS